MTILHVKLLFLYVFSTQTELVLSSIWSYALSQPIKEGAYEDAEYQHRQNRQPDRTNDIITKVNNGTTTIEMLEEPPQVCMSDRHCGRGYYCDRHYGICSLHSRFREPCRRDGHCKRHMECVFGRCRMKIPSPLPGAKCSDGRGCGTDSCCARKHGERICQLRLPEGTKCYVPRGGLAYTLNEICPCQIGLVCRQSIPPHPHADNMTDIDSDNTRTPLAMKRRNPRDLLKCVTT